MRFGVREICEVVLRAKATQYLGKKKFYKDEPVLYFDTLKTSSLEGASTTVYATGGRGNTRLVAWEGERTLTFTMEDALISPESFAILSGAGLLDVNKDAPIYVHTTSRVEVKEKNTIVLPQEACWNKYDREDGLYKDAADIFVMTTTDGQIDAEPCIPYSIAADHKTLTCYSHAGTIDVGEIVLVDYYIKKIGGAQLIEITADKFGGNYYLEASTLFRDETSGVDMPAEFIIPNCKVQSNFTFTMAASGDPSTFTFTMDAFPDYTKFDKTHKVLASLQVITEAVDDKEDKREACKLFEVDAFAGIEVTYDNDGAETLIKVKAMGDSIDGYTPNSNADTSADDRDEFSYEEPIFGDLTDKGSFGQINLHFNSLKNEENYTVIQDNPALKVAYPNGGNGIEGENKTKSYTGAQLADGYALLLGETRGPVSVKVLGSDNKVNQVVQITNQVNFAKKCKITIIDEDSKVDTSSYAVNEKTTTDFSKVLSGDTICFKANDATSVKANGKVIVKDALGFYVINITSDTTVTVL